MADTPPSLRPLDGGISTRSMSKEKLPSENSLECVTGDFKRFDVAVAVAAGHASDGEIDKLADRRLRRKIDKHLLPLLFFIYCGMFVPV